jgi:hypothetical protein
MSCCPTEDALFLFASGEPGDDVARHVADCPTCQAVVDEIRGLDQVLRADTLDEPDAAFFDEMAADVMAAVEDAERGGEVIEFRPPSDAADGRSTRRTLALAAAAVVLLGVALALTADRRAEEPVEVPVADAEPSNGSAIPDEATARALAAELGISLDPIDPAAVAEAEVVDRVTAESLQTGGLDALVNNLQDTETEALHVGLGDDVFAALAELDVDELAAVLETLES